VITGCLHLPYSTRSNLPITSRKMSRRRGAKRVKQVSDGKSCERKNGHSRDRCTGQRFAQAPNSFKETSEVLRRYDRIRLTSCFLQQLAVGKSQQFFLCKTG
jgi:hypothetical protein